ncbi:lactonase family protein [Nonomuraea sp. NPDC050556]|uniref:lactonase family protein n=1 Tax=Nonomuraea sp. NPDC050556 TaxID=3364369 RepID=UPI0037A91B3E
MKHLYLGGYGPDILATDRTLTPLAAAPVASASFLAAHPTLPVLYAVGETGKGTLVALTADLEVRAERPSEGDSPCHLAVHPSGEVLAVANYMDGVVSLHHLGADGLFTGDPIVLRHEGSGPVESRQEGPHAHQAVWDGDTLLVSDLGTDEIRRYTRDGEALDPVRLAPGMGPRHFVRHGDRWFVAGELDNRVHVYDAGWTEIDSVYASFADSYPSHIEAADGLVYVGNRGPDTITVMSADTLERIAEVPSGGAWPRHFAIDGDRMLVANQNSGGVAVLPLTHGIPDEVVQVFPMESPACVLIG